MKRAFPVCLYFMLLVSLITSCTSIKDFQVQSPDGIVKLIINHGGTENSTPASDITFSVFFNDILVLDKSQFALRFKGMPAFGRDLKVTGMEQNAIDETWERVYGKSKKVRNHCNELMLELTETGGNKRKINLVFRVYNNGIAFRYYILGQDAITDFSISRENTVLIFAGDHKVWATHWNDFITSQEQEFVEENLSDLKMDDILGTPLLVRIDTAVWAAILEANLTDWAGMCLSAGPEPNSIITRLSPLPDEQDMVVKSTAPRYSPWRVIMLADHPGRFIESDILDNLNEPCALEDVTWINPGKCAWDWWWSDGYAPDMKRKLGPDTESHKYFIDFAAEMGWDYQLVDWFWYGPPFSSMETWEPNPESDITKHTGICDVPEIVKYANSKDVKTIVWLEWHHADRQMEEAFPLYEKWGISGVKVDFMNRNDQEMVNLYHRVIKKAAQHHLLVDFHGAYMPTGENRTYPNLITREGVLGNEYNKWSDRITPDHCLTIPFTRMLGGDMDFTPGGFVHGNRNTFKNAANNSLPYAMVMGTRCFQLAMLIVYQSALQVICDSPYNYRKSPDGLDFLKIVPVTWDETKVLEGEVGDYIIVARRSGNEWYIGGMTDWDSRTLRISFDFLDEGAYKAQLWKDTPDSGNFPERLIKENLEFNNQESTDLILAPAGGFVMHVFPE